MFLLNGKPLALDVPFTTEDGTQYPANWLRLSSLEEKQAIGITEVPDPEVYDDRFYWGVGAPKQLEDETITPEDGDPYTTKGLKSQVIAQIKATAHGLLAPTDWVVMRQLLKGVGMSAHVENFRNAVVDASNQFEQQITACASVEELAALQFTWPDAKDF